MVFKIKPYFVFFRDYSMDQFKNLPLLFDYPLILNTAFSNKLMFKSEKAKKAAFNELLDSHFSGISVDEKTKQKQDLPKIVASLRYFLIFISFFTFLIPLFNGLQFLFFKASFITLFTFLVLVALLFVSAFNISSYLNKIQ